MTTAELPADLIRYLESASPRELETGIYGVVELLAAAELQVGAVEVTPSLSPFARDDPHRHDGGCYLVPAVNLVRGPRGSDEFPAWLLLWLPGEQRYGSFDLDHGDLMMFESGASWSDIAAAASSYVLSSDGGGGGGVSIEYLRPWPRYPYRKPCN